jgi:hypothetical protein
MLSGAGDASSRPCRIDACVDPSIRGVAWDPMRHAIATSIDASASMDVGLRGDFTRAASGVRNGMMNE